MKPYDTLIYIGRFQGFHNGHLDSIIQASALCSKLIILVGAATELNERNPYSPVIVSEDVRSIVRLENSRLNGCLIQVSTLDDNPSNEVWINSLKDFVTLSNATGIVGYEKDASSSYLKWFGDVLTHIPLEPYRYKQELLNATDIRAAAQRKDYEYLTPRVHPIIFKRITQC